MGRPVHFYAPGLRRFATREYAGQNAAAFVSISVTGSECALMCDHCQARVLETMIPLKQRGTLFDLCQGLAARGARGALISGGCDRLGRVPLLPHLPDMVRVRQELGLALRVHPGLVEEGVAAGLARVGVDGAMLDIIGAEETIRDVYHMDVPVASYELSLERLAQHGVPAVPHIVLGLHFGRFLGEDRALEMVAGYPRRAAVLVVLQPLYGTLMAITPPPPVEEIGRFFVKARTVLADSPLFLGCARPLGPVKAAIDRLAVEAGLDGIAYPAEGIVQYARDRGRTPQFHNACCGVGWTT
jgi:uncharacterized radical SAM superfamily protein